VFLDETLIAIAICEFFWETLSMDSSCEAKMNLNTDVWRKCRKLFNKT
jgi:hypothetical protein